MIKAIIRKLDPSNLTSDDLKSIRHSEHEIFKSVLPYTAKNGIMFYSNKVSLCASKGLIFIDNYGSHGTNKKGNPLYKLMLRYAPTYSNESRYNLSCIVDSFDEKALEKVSIVIQKANEEFAKSLIN